MDEPSAQDEREQRRLHWMWIQKQSREHERRKQQFSAQFERERAEILRLEGEDNRDSRSDDNRESRDEPSASHRRERNTSPMVKEKRLTFTVEAKEADPNRPTLNYENVFIARRSGEGSRPIFDRPEILVNQESSSNFATHRRTSNERASSYAPAEEFRTIAVVNPANSSTASAPRRTDHRRPAASSSGREPARFQSSSSSSSSSFCRRFKEISLVNHRSRDRSRSRGPRPNERDDHRRVHRRSRSASRHLRADASESRRSHRSRFRSRSRTSQRHRSSGRRRSSRSPERPRRHRSSRSRSRSPSRRGSREETSVYGPRMPYPFIMQPPGMFPMGPFPGGVVNPLPRFPFPPPPPPPPRHPASRFNAGNPYYRAPYR